MSDALRKHLIWLESRRLGHAKHWQPLRRVSDGSLKRGLTPGRTCNQFEFHRRPISRRHISQYSLFAGAEHFVDGLRKATVLEE